MCACEARIGECLCALVFVCVRVSPFSLSLHTNIMSFKVPRSRSFHFCFVSVVYFVWIYSFKYFWFVVCLSVVFVCWFLVTRLHRCVWRLLCTTIFDSTPLQATLYVTSYHSNRMENFQNRGKRTVNKLVCLLSPVSFYPSTENGDCATATAVCIELFANFYSNVFFFHRIFCIEEYSSELIVSLSIVMHVHWNRPK